MRPIVLLFAIAAISGDLAAQQAARRPFVRATGQGIVSVRPDQAKIDLGVLTQAATAQDATAQNATQVDNVLAKLRQLIGAAADIRTTSYSVTPNHQYPKDGGAPTLANYTATNVVQVTLSDLSLAGRVIDTATQAGANTVRQLQFGLKDEQPVRQQALKMAAAQARSHADAIAAGLGLKTGVAIAAEEGGSASIVPLDRTGVVAQNATTPVQSGTLDVVAYVTLEVELVQ